MAPPPRVAFFPDSFHEVNGVAHTSRNFVAFAERHGLPFLSVRAGRALALTVEGSVRALELPRSRLSLALEQDLRFDLLFARHLPAIGRELREFRPDLLHITGPSELGLAGAFFASRLGIPLVASWHTNVHEYAARRLQPITRRLPARTGDRLGRGAEAAALWATTRFYRLARVLFAPNPPLCALLERTAGRPCHVMERGVDTELFSPAHRTRTAGDGGLVLGYVGRLSVEKNVALLPRIDAQLRAGGIEAQWEIVGQGAEEVMLRRALPRCARFRGVLRGAELAQAYADMDLLVFPSHTDTFGNVVLEALASGAGAIVTPDGGPRFIVQNDEVGRIVPDDGFAPAIAAIARDPGELSRMRLAAREHALGYSWDAVFDRVYAAYQAVLPQA